MRRQASEPETAILDRILPLLPAIKKRLAQQDVAGLARILGSDRALLGLVTRALEQPVSEDLAISNEALLLLRKAVASAQLGPVPPTREPERSTARLRPVPAAARLS